MNCKIGIIAVSLLVCSLAGPAWAELSETAAAGDGTKGLPLSAQENGDGQAGINSLLDRFAGIGSSEPSAGGAPPLLAVVPSISETTLFTAFTRAGSPMKAYYSRSGSDNKQSIIANSRFAVVTTSLGDDRFVLPEAGLAFAAIQWHFVGSGAVVGGESIAPIQTGASAPSVIQNNFVPPGYSFPGGDGGNGQQSIPLPLPFLLTGSGLAALLALRKRAGLQYSHTELNLLTTPPSPSPLGPLGPPIKGGELKIPSPPGGRGLGRGGVLIR